MADDYRVPSKEELYALVDERFREAHPDAPERLDAEGDEHAELRDDWGRIHAGLVNELANRIYWDAFPDAPVVIDPHQPGHRRYADAWNDIHAQLLANRPVPPIAAGTPPTAVDAGLSEVRAGMYERLAHMLRQTPAAMHHRLQATIDWHIFEALKVARGDDGRYPGYVSDKEIIEHTEPGSTEPLQVTLQVGVMGTENYGVSSWVDFEVFDPNIDLLDENGDPLIDEPDATDE